MYLDYYQRCTWGWDPTRKIILVFNTVKLLLPSSEDSNDVFSELFTVCMEMGSNNQENSSIENCETASPVFGNVNAMFLASHINAPFSL